MSRASAADTASSTDASMPEARRARRTAKRSTSSSSTKRMFIGYSALRHVYKSPILIQRRHEFGEAWKRDRFKEIPSHVEIKSFNLVLLRIRRRQNDNGDGAQFRILAQFTKEFDSVHPWHVQIKQHEASVFWNFTRSKHLQTLDAVECNIEGVGDFILVEGAPDIQHIDFVV